jgi:hypothetical protein
MPLFVLICPKWYPSKCIWLDGTSTLGVLTVTDCSDSWLIDWASRLVGSAADVLGLKVDSRPELLRDKASSTLAILEAISSLDPGFSVLDNS